MECPSRKTLTEYALGEPNPRATEIATHVDGCSSCMSFLGGVIDQLREFADLGPPTASEQAVLEAEVEDCWQDFVERYGAALGIGDDDRC